MVPRMKPMRKTMIAYSAPAFVARNSWTRVVENDPAPNPAGPRRFHPKESPSSVDLLRDEVGCLCHSHLDSAVARDSPRRHERERRDRDC